MMNINKEQAYKTAYLVIKRMNSCGLDGDKLQRHIAAIILNGMKPGKEDTSKYTLSELKSLLEDYVCIKNKKMRAHILSYFYKKFSRATLKEIAVATGRTTHATVINSLRVISEYRASYPSLNDKLVRVSNQLITKNKKYFKQKKWDKLTFIDVYIRVNKKDTTPLR